MTAVVWVAQSSVQMWRQAWTRAVRGNDPLISDQCHLGYVFAGYKCGLPMFMTVLQGSKSLFISMGLPPLVLNERPLPAEG